MTTGISLHIGLNRVDPTHYQDEHGQPWDGALNACENDAKAMQALAKVQGFQTQLLLSAEATADVAIQAIQQAAQKLQTGDIFLLTYSGHGGQVPDRNSEEDDDMDETWCLYDREVVDDELYALWAGFKPGVRILMLSDSCHSGTVAKDPNLMEIAAEEGVKIRALPIDVQAATYRKHKDLYDGLQAKNPAGDQAEVAASVILISGCQDNQSSYDGIEHSKFTGKLLKVWNNGQFKGNLLYFKRRIAAEMPYYQSPNLFKVGTPSRQFERQKPFTV